MNVELFVSDVYVALMKHRILNLGKYTKECQKVFLMRCSLDEGRIIESPAGASKAAAGTDILLYLDHFFCVCVCVLVEHLVCVLQASIDIAHTSLYGQCVCFHPSASWNHSVIYITLQPRNTPAFVEIHGM